MKKFFSYALLIVTAATIGVVAGIAGKKLLGPTEIDYSGALDSLKIDADAIVKKIDEYSGSKDKTEEFSVGDILNYSMEKFRRCENCCSFTFGVADTIVKQDILGCAIKNGNKYFEESVSKSSMVALANRMFQTEKNSAVELYSANKKSIQIAESGAVADYTSDNKQNFTAEQYKNDYGKTLDEMFIYFICDETITNSKIDKSETGYSIQVDLDPDLSTNGYKHQMMSISGLDCLPTFQNVKLTFNLDKDLKLKKLSIDENYTATMIMEADTHGIVDIYYYSDEYVKIPELNEKVNYKKGN